MTIRVFSELVEPTAAMAWLLSQLPTTIISAALNSSCNIPDSTSGIENRNIFPGREPEHMSIVISRFNVRHLDNLRFVSRALTIIADMFRKFNRLREIYYDSYHIAKETSSVELRVLQYFSSRAAVTGHARRSGRSQAP